jgi:uncharacterized membrane protein YdfJ with MMPL/SSD domain
VTTCKFGAPTLNGGKSSSLNQLVRMMVTSQSKTTRETIRELLMLMDQLMKKLDQLRQRSLQSNRTKDGKLSMLTSTRLKPKDYIKNSVSTSTDHSTLSQDFHCTELPKLLEQAMSSSEDMSKVELPSNSSLMVSLRPSSLNSGRTIVLKSNPMVDMRTSE